MKPIFIIMGVSGCGKSTVGRLLAEELSTHHWFNINAAKKDLTYHPQVTIEEGLQKLKRWIEDEKLNRIS